MPASEIPRPANALSAPRLLGHAVWSTSLGIGCGMLLFPGEASIIGVVLSAFAQAKIVRGLLDRNRDEIWTERRPPGEANRRLAGALLVLFLGVFATYVVAVQVTPFGDIEDWFGRQLGEFAGGSMLDLEFKEFASLLGSNALVLVGCFLFALLYRHGGMMLVLAWNASRWGVIFSWVALVATRRGDAHVADYLGRTLACILPHLVVEALAYVLAAMSGVFLSRALARYRLASPEFSRVSVAVLEIAAFAAALLVGAALLEAFVTPRLVAALFGARG